MTDREPAFAGQASGGLASAAVSEADVERLVAAASDARARAYAPYSNFRVGAALLCSDGAGNAAIVTGCNVENASYPASLCAERAAVGAAFSKGLRRIHAAAIATDASRPSSPCGVCRQVLMELAPELEVVSVAADGERARWSIAQLLPHAFVPESLARG